MRAGGLLIIALAVTALLHRRRKPIEDARDESPYGDWPHIPLSSRGVLPFSAAALPERCVTAAPASYPEAIEQDGWITVTPINNEGRN